MKKITKLFFLLGVGAGFFASQINAAPRYKAGDTGVFGSGESWNYNAVMAQLAKVDDIYSARFSVFNEIIIDRAWQRLIAVPEGTVLNVGIQQDDGNGKPDGKWLASADITPQAGNSFAQLVFGEVKLDAGNVYHFVIVVKQLKTGKMRIYGNSGKNIIRPYDRALDDKFTAMSKTGNRAWRIGKRNPFIVFGNGDKIISHIGQPYGSQIIGSLHTQGGRGAASGQQFVITDQEVPAGSVVNVTSIKIAVRKRGNIVDPLIINICSTDGTVLGSAQLQPDAADGKIQTLDFDKSAALVQGESYLLTTQFGGSGGTVKQMYLLPSSVCKIAGSGVASWGGTTICFPVKSGENNSWQKFKPVNVNQDLRFTLHGTVSTK